MEYIISLIVTLLAGWTLLQLSLLLIGYGYGVLEFIEHMKDYYNKKKERRTANKKLQKVIQKADKKRKEEFEYHKIIISRFIYRSVSAFIIIIIMGVIIVCVKYQY